MDGSFGCSLDDELLLAVNEAEKNYIRDQRNGNDSVECG